MGSGTRDWSFSLADFGLSAVCNLGIKGVVRFGIDLKLDLVKYERVDETSLSRRVYKGPSGRIDLGFRQRKQGKQCVAAMIDLNLLSVSLFRQFGPTSKYGLSFDTGIKWKEDVGWEFALLGFKYSTGGRDGYGGYSGLPCCAIKGSHVLTSNPL